MSDTPAQIRRWTRLEYGRLIEKHVFRPDERLELLGGELVVHEPHGDPHTLAVELVNEALVAAFGPYSRAFLPPLRRRFASRSSGSHANVGARLAS